MKRSYSTYDAKTHFSEVMRTVRSGRAVRITYHGRPIAEIVPLSRQSATLAERIGDLESSGIVTAPQRAGALRPLAKRKGALARFLKDRD